MSSRGIIVLKVNYCMIIIDNARQQHVSTRRDETRGFQLLNTRVHYL